MNAHNNKHGFESPVVDKGTIEIKRDVVFQGNNMLLFVLCMVQLTMILRKAWLDVSLRAIQSQKVSHVLFMCDLKVYGKDHFSSLNKIIVNLVYGFSVEIWMEFNII